VIVEVPAEAADARGEAADVLPHTLCVCALRLIVLLLHPIRRLLIPSQLVLPGAALGLAATLQHHLVLDRSSRGNVSNRLSVLLVLTIRPNERLGLHQLAQTLDTFPHTHHVARPPVPRIRVPTPLRRLPREKQCDFRPHRPDQQLTAILPGESAYIFSINSQQLVADRNQPTDRSRTSLGKNGDSFRVAQCHSNANHQRRRR
jgi:hypothetical protein